MRGNALRLLVLGCAAVVFTLFAGSTSRAEGPNAVLDLAGCRTNTLPDNDDGSTGTVPIGFTINFFGDTYDSLWVNNNGNVTFDGPLSTYIAFDLTTATHPMIATFFGDVDTRSRSNGALDVTYGQTSYNGRAAFCVDWVNVGQYSANYGALTSAQLLLVDAGNGNFDMMMNYDKVGWDHSGTVGIGYTNGSGNPNTFYELPGSRTSGALLDGSPTGLVHSNLNTAQLGRYLFSVRGGSLPIGGSIGGAVTLAAGGGPVASAPVQVCPTGTGRCRISVTNSAGGYNVSGLPAGSYMVTVNAPSNSALLAVQGGPVTVTPPGPSTLNLQMTGPTPPPPGTSITHIGENGGIPTVYWNDALTLTTTGCAGATVTFQIATAAAGVVRTGPMTEDTPGSYIVHTPALFPAHGNAQVSFTIVCPGGATTNPGFNIYIDPSGTVVDQTGAPVPGATVTLFRSDLDTGPFVQVPDGDATMSPANRTNPDATGLDGHFGWDVLAGFYVVRAEKAGCHAPGDPSTSFVESAVLDIPPPVTNLVLTLDCGVAPLPLVPPPPPVVDMAVSQTLAPATIHVGDTAVVTLTATNLGLNAGTKVALSDQLPDGLTAVGTDAGGGVCTLDGGQLACTRSGSMAVGSTWTVQVRVHADRAGSFTLHGGVGAREPDPNVGENNSSDAVLTAIAPPALTTGEPGAAAPPLQVLRKHGAALVLGSIQSSTAATLRLAVTDPAGKALALLQGSAMGGSTGQGGALSAAVQPGPTSLFLRLKPHSVKKGVQYTVAIVATNDAGSTTLTLRFVG